MFRSFLILTLFVLLSVHAMASTDPFSEAEGDIQVGGDIFNDFNADLDDKQMLEDERFWRYGRFFTFSLSLGLTSPDGNRGRAYVNDPPAYGVSFQYFSDFQTSFGMGFELSKHHIMADYTTASSEYENLGEVDITMLRFHFSYRYYLDTANYGTAITYSNPYFTARMEYWDVTSKFVNRPDLTNETGGGFGFGFGGGLEFPIKLHESYLGVEALYHVIDLDDTYSQVYKPVADGSPGYEDLTGNIYSLMIAYVFNW